MELYYHRLSYLLERDTTLCEAVYRFMEIFKTDKITVYHKEPVEQKMYLFFLSGLTGHGKKAILVQR